jgi:hypothetical protein
LFYGFKSLLAKLAVRRGNQPLTIAVGQMDDVFPGNGLHRGRLPTEQPATHPTAVLPYTLPAFPLTANRKDRNSEKQKFSNNEALDHWMNAERRRMNDGINILAIP